MQLLVKDRELRKEFPYQPPAPSSFLVSLMWVHPAFWREDHLVSQGNRLSIRGKWSRTFYRSSRSAIFSISYSPSALTASIFALQDPWSSPSAYKLFTSIADEFPTASSADWNCCYFREIQTTIVTFHVYVNDVTSIHNTYIFAHSNLKKRIPEMSLENTYFAFNVNYVSYGFVISFHDTSILYARSYYSPV